MECQKHEDQRLRLCRAGFSGADTSGEMSVSSLIDALAGNIGRPLLLDVRRGQEQLKLSITACEARNA